MARRGDSAERKPGEAFAELRERFADRIARLAGLYGVNPLLGRLYAVLLLSPDPMSLDDVTEAAGSAKSTASVALRNLEKYRLVHRHWRKSDRRTFYEARTDFARMFEEWRELFLERDLAAAGTILREAADGVESLAGTTPEGARGGRGAARGRDAAALSSGAFRAEDVARLAARLKAVRTALDAVVQAVGAVSRSPEAEPPEVALLLPPPERLTIEVPAR